MDTSKEFILMSEKAVEIQEGWSPKTGDVCFREEIVALVPGSAKNSGEEWKAESIWLPTQSQLQAMVGDCNNPYPIIESFYEFALNPKRLDGIEEIMLSMEQLWLAFVMRENNKTWDGEVWQSVEVGAIC